MELTSRRIFRARWSEDIEREWIDNLIKRKPDADREKIRSRCERMNKYGRSITGYKDFIDSINLPDQGDRHVLAAAIVGRVDAIITFNLKHFPSDYISQFGIECMGPDEFLYHQYTLEPMEFILAVKEIRKRLSKPKYDPDGYIENLKKNNLPIIADALEQIKDLI